MIDTHCHLEKKDYDNLDEVIKKMDDNIIITSGVDKQTNIECINLSEKYKNVFCTIGIHPEYANESDEQLNEMLKHIENNINNKRVVGIGEIGLDYYYDNSPREVQKEWFKKQIELANELKLPIIIHDRDAHQDTFEIIKNTKSPEIGCVLHCYSGNVELAKEYVKMGCYISIPGTVTFKNNKKTREVAKEIPLEYLLIETDSPYMAPEPHRGKRNDPSLVAFVADKIAQEKGISYEKVCEATKENAKRLFNIK